jgi:hypothetical protein
MGAMAVLWERSTPMALEQAIVIRDSEFQLDFLKELSERVLERNGSKPIVQVWFSPDVNQIARSPRALGQPYPLWRKDYLSTNQQRRHIAQLLAVGGRAVLRIRDGTIARELPLKGPSPLRWTVGGVDVSIIHWGIGNSVFPIKIFAQSPVLDVALSQDLYDRLASFLETAGLYVVIRVDPWFASHVEFPSDFPFLEGIPPREEEWDRAPYVECADYGKGAECRGVRITP